jgi:hypothetical protein
MSKLAVIYYSATGNALEHLARRVVAVTDRLTK